VTVAAILQLVGSGHDRDDAWPLVVTRLILVESRDVDRHVVEDIYRAELTHSGPPGSRDFAAVTARVVHPFAFPGLGDLEIVDGDLEFGSVRAGQTVESRDTFAIRRHQHYPLKLQHLRWAISGRPDLVLSESWAGNWRFTLTSKNADTNQTTAVDEIVESIGINEPVGFSRLPDSVQCTWTDADHLLQADCRARFRFAACAADSSAHFAIERNASSMTGQGQWYLTVTGDCGPNTDSGGESIQIVGERLTGDAEPEPFSPGVLTKLATTPALIRLIAGRPDDTATDPPTSDADCQRGRWRRLTNPWFRNARACMAFVDRHHSGPDEGRR
jgi:hypothetical protein